MLTLILLAIIGIIAVAYRVYYFLSPFITYFILHNFLSKRKDLKKAGDWAIVTGSTDGIGKAFAHELARDGLNVFLICRSTEKLTNVANEIESLFKVKTKIFIADFTTTDFYENLQEEIKGLSSVAILVNNVGVAYAHVDSLVACEDLTLENLQNMIVCNTISTTCMTRITLPKMLASPPPPADVHRYILSISSLVGCLPAPYLSVYAGTKAFVNNFTASLAGELEGTCVKVQTLTPSLVATNMSGIKQPTFIVPSAKKFADSALSMLGVRSQLCGYLPHELFLTYVVALPRWLRRVRFGSYLQKAGCQARDHEKLKDL